MNLSGISEPIQLATSISSILNEPEVHLILSVILVKGPSFTLETFEKTLGILTQEPLSTKSGAPRTPGGTFFYLLRATLPKSDLEKIFKPHLQQKNRRRRARKKLQKKFEKLSIASPP